MRPSNYSKQFAVFFLLSMAALSLILYFTVNQSTLEALKRTRPDYLLYMLGLSVADITLDGFRNFFLVRASTAFSHSGLPSGCQQ